MKILKRIFIVVGRLMHNYFLQKKLMLRIYFIKNKKTIVTTLVCTILIVALYYFKSFNWSGFVAGMVFTYMVAHFVGRFLLAKALKRHDIKNKL